MYVVAASRSLVDDSSLPAPGISAYGKALWKGCRMRVQEAKPSQLDKSVRLGRECCASVAQLL
jgi:hypothetical protein